jgi:hypothetical protein
VQFFGVGIIKVKAYLNYEKGLMQIIHGVTKQMSCRQIFNDFNMLPVAGVRT